MRQTGRCKRSTKEHAYRVGHIPGARNIPWTQDIDEDGTFKPVEELEISESLM